MTQSKKIKVRCHKKTGNIPLKVCEVTTITHNEHFIWPSYAIHILKIRYCNWLFIHIVIKLSNDLSYIHKCTRTLIILQLSTRQAWMLRSGQSLGGRRTVNVRAQHGVNRWILDWIRWGQNFAEIGWTMASRSNLKAWNSCTGMILKVQQILVPAYSSGGMRRRANWFVSDTRYSTVQF